MDLNKSLKLSRRLSFVPRWSVVPVLRQQSVAEHSFHVACAARWLLQHHATWVEETQYSRLERDVLHLALSHDEEESITGDHPSNSKDKPSPATFGQVKLVVKIADRLEAVAFIEEERRMGNNYGMQEIRSYLDNELQDFWLHFALRDSSNRLKLTSDLIREYLSITVNAQFPHPHLDYSDV